MSENKISTGSYDLNKWLYGGYEKEIITMIAGSPGSGKTNFCILAACSQAKKGNKVIFIDTEGGFSVDRVKQIAGENYKEFLENILLLSLTDFSEQKKIILNLSKRVNSNQVNLIIIDGMAMLYRLELGDAIKENNTERIREVNRQVAEQMKALSKIAKNSKIPIIITNQVYSDFQTLEQKERGEERTTNIVGGDLFKYWSKCIIELKNHNGKRKAIILKHRSLPQREINFEIKNKGIFKKRWI